MRLEVSIKKSNVNSFPGRKLLGPNAMQLSSGVDCERHRVGKRLTTMRQRKMTNCLANCGGVHGKSNFVHGRVGEFNVEKMLYIVWVDLWRQDLQGSGQSYTLGIKHGLGGIPKIGHVTSPSVRH